MRRDKTVEEMLREKDAAQRAGQTGGASHSPSGNGKAERNGTHAGQAAANGQQRAESPPPPDGGLKTTRLSELKPRPIRWLVPRYLPLGKLIVWAGDGGHG